MKLLCYGVLLLHHIALCAGNAGSFTDRLAGVRRCLSLHGGDEMEVLAMKQRYGKESFLVARPKGSPKLVAKAALHATYEALLRGGGCADMPDAGSTKWFLDVGTDDDEILALASSLGCGVSVLDPEVKDVRAVDMTRCMNEEPGRPFVVFQVTVSDVTNPETLANMTHPAQLGSSVAPAEKTKSLFAHRKKEKSLIGALKPTMLNGILKKKREAEKAKEQKKLAEEQKKLAEEQKKLDEEKQRQLAEQKKKELAEEEARKEAEKPMENAVMLDTIFTAPGASNSSEAFEVAGPSGVNVLVNQISVLKVTPRSESAATLKALLGARGLLESGRVQCLVTEMNFDVNHTETLLKYVGDLEHLGFQFAHLGSLDYSELEVTDQGQYEVFRTDSAQLQELFETYKRIRSFDERSGFRVYSGSLSLDRKGHYFDYTDHIFACKGGFPKQLPVLEKGIIRFRNGMWWLEKNQTSL